MAGVDGSAAGYAWRPKPELVAASTLTAFLHKVGEPDYEALLARADADPAWLQQAVFEFCDFRFYRPYQQMLDMSDGIEWARWCVGGTTNIVLNCLDRHRGTPVWDQIFLVWEGEDGEQRRYTYRAFDAEVCRLAAGLRALGIGRGDIVGLYLPNLPETYIAFFAVLKLGAILMPLFSGFGAQPLATRLADGGAKAVITADGAWRRGEKVPMKAVLDDALAAADTVEHVVVVPRTGSAPAMRAGRDHAWDDVVAGRLAELPTEPMEAEAPAVLLYTSGTTGRPKGCVWTHVGFLGSMVTRDVHICGDFKPSDRYFFMSDMGWMVGAMTACIPSYFGASLLVAEGVPDYPETDRYWRLVDEHRVSYLGVSPTLVRSLMRHGDAAVDARSFEALRITCSGGEAWTEAPWRWFFEHVCKRRLPIINITGGTEVGGCNYTGTVHHPLKPGSFGGPALGVGADIVDGNGASVAPGQVGELVLRNPGIGMTKGLWRDPERYLESYWRTIPRVWVHGDFARRDPDGLCYLLGRSDDTIKVAGKRTGPSELESLLLATGQVSDAAVVGVADAVKGSAIVCACVTMPGITADAALERRLEQAVVDGMGASYRPSRVLLVAELPKTRNMKVMRRVVRAVCEGQDPGDVSSLVNPEAIDELRERATPTQPRAAQPKQG